MINALPSSNQPDPTKGGSPMPPEQKKSDQGTTPPLDMAGTQASNSNTSMNEASKPHQDTSGYSESLAKKIHGDSIGSSADSATTPITTTSTAEPQMPDKSMGSVPPAYKKKFDPKMMLGALVIGLVIVGGAAGYYLTQQNQDVRQQAASEEVTGTETSRTPTDWGIFNQQWHDFMNDPNNSWVEYVNLSQEPAGARYQCDAPIMKVGEETLYGCDLNALYVLYEPESYITAGAISPQDPQLNTVLDALITNSGLLQEAQKRGEITLDESIYNSPSKDPVARINALRELRDRLGHTIDKTVDYEAIVIYFHNQVDPKIPLAEAQAAAKAKMDVLYQRLNNGEITMETAGKEIAANDILGDTTGVSLADLDTLYADNAYQKRVQHVFDDRFFKDTSLDEELKSLGEGQMSTVRLCKDFSFTDEEYFASLETDDPFESPLVDSCYIIFKLNKINFGWLDEGSSTVSAEDAITTEYTKQTSKMTENLKQ